MNHKERYFNEKSSHGARELLEGSTHRNPNHMDDFHDRENQVKKVESVEDMKHRSDIAYYSDVFWKDQHTDMPVRGNWHPKKTGSPEDRIVRHPDWSDSHTEVIIGS